MSYRARLKWWVSAMENGDVLVEMTTEHDGISISMAVADAREMANGIL